MFAIILWLRKLVYLQISVKKLRMDMLCGYLTSFQLPITSSKQQLIEHLTHHIHSLTSQCSHSQPSKPKMTRTGGKKAPASTQSMALPPPPEPSPLEPSCSNSEEEDTGSPDSPSEDGAAHSVIHPAVGCRHHRDIHAPVAPLPIQATHLAVHQAVVEGATGCRCPVSLPSGGHNTNTQKCHASPSYSLPSKRQRYRHLTALHLNQKCRYLDVVITTIGTAPYQPC